MDMKIDKKMLRELVREVVIEQMELLEEANSRDEFKRRIKGLLSGIFTEWAQARICEANEEYPSGIHHWDNIEVPRLFRAFFDVYNDEFTSFKDHRKALDEIKPFVEKLAPKSYRQADQHALVSAQSLNRQLKNFKVDLNIDDLLVKFWELVDDQIKQFSIVDTKKRSQHPGYKK